MVSCSITRCKNRTNKNLSKGVTFHRFPHNPEIKEKWINATGRQNWFPSKLSTVCSEHFNPEDFCPSKGGRRFLIKNSVPTQQIYRFQKCKNCLTLPHDSTRGRSMIKNELSLPSTSLPSNDFILTPITQPSHVGFAIGCSNSPMHFTGEEKNIPKIEIPNEEYDICRVCLRSDLALYEMQCGLGEYYQRLTGVTASSSPSLPQAVCGCCAHLLRKFHKLQQSALLANDTLHSLLREHGQVSKGILSSMYQRVNMTTSLHNLEPCILKSLNFPDTEHTDDAENSDIFSECKVEPDIGFYLNDDEIVEEVQKLQMKVEYLDEASGENAVEANDKADPKQDIGSDFNDDDDGDCDDRVDNDMKSWVPVVDAAKAKQSIKVKKSMKNRKKLKNWYMKLSSHFTIRVFTPHEQRTRVIQRKETENYKNSTYKCELCFKGYDVKESFESHMSRHTDTAVYGTEACPACKLLYKMRRYANTHITAHHKLYFTCNTRDCSFETCNRHEASKHLQSHEGRTTLYSCPHCDAVYQKETSYLSHVRLLHPAAGRACPLCGYSFVGAKGIHQHMRLKHRDTDAQLPPDAPACALCDVKFISEAALRTHQRVSPKHQGPEGRLRNEAKEGVRKARRRRAAAPDVVTPCELCGEQLAGAKAYYHHFRRAHRGVNRTRYLAAPRRVMCEVCGKMCQSPTHLRYHADTHAAPDASVAHACGACELAFRTRERLNAHRRAAHGAQPPLAKCRECGKCVTAKNLSRHMMLHRSERPHQCTVCTRRFLTRSEARAHHRHKHLGAPYGRKTGARRRPPPPPPPPAQPDTETPQGGGDIQESLT